jgi:hypothetical protein
MTDFEKNVFRSLIREVNNFSNNNKQEIKRIRETTNLISKEMLEYIAENDLYDIFTENRWSGVFVPGNYFSKIEIPEIFVKNLNMKVDAIFNPIKEVLAGNFLNLNIPKEWISLYPNSFDYKRFKPDVNLFELLIDKYPDIIFNYNSLNSTVRKKFAQKKVTDEFLNRYVKHIDFSTADWYRGENSKFSQKVVEYLLDSIPKIDDPNYYRVFRSLLNAITAMSGAMTFGEFAKLTEKNHQVFVDNPALTRKKNDLIKEVTKEKDGMIRDFNYYIHLYKLGLNMEEIDFSEVAMIPLEQAVKLSDWDIQRVFSNFLTNDYNSLIYILEASRILFDDEFLTRQFVKRNNLYLEKQAYKKANPNRVYWNISDEENFENIMTIIKENIENDPIKKKRHGQFVSATLLRIKLG